jgi:hypothetical protein
MVPHAPSASPSVEKGKRTKPKLMTKQKSSQVKVEEIVLSYSEPLASTSSSDTTSTVNFVVMMELAAMQCKYRCDDGACCTAL